jgi:hypothetical protein
MELAYPDATLAEAAISRIGGRSDARAAETIAAIEGCGLRSVQPPNERSENEN